MNDRVDAPNTRFSITDQEALQFHSRGRPGKLEIMPTKPMATQRDLSLAYSPGVAVPVKSIAADPSTAFDYTTRGNMVAVISNGTAILGLGNLGALASKPVMEGKAVLFKRFADVDSIDLEVGTEDPDEFINAVKYAHPTGVPLIILVDCEPSPDGKLLLTISDDGVGLPEGFVPERDGGMGFKVMYRLAQEMGCDLRILSTHLGLSFRLTLTAGTMAGAKLA